LSCKEFDFTGGTLDCTDNCRYDVSGCAYGGETDEGRVDISDLIKQLNTAIMEAKLENKDTTQAEALLLDAIKEYAGESPDYASIEAKLADVETLLAGGQLEERKEGDSPYIVGVIVLGLLLMLAFVLKGLGAKSN